LAPQGRFSIKSNTSLTHLRRVTAQFRDFTPAGHERIFIREVCHRNSLIKTSRTRAAGISHEDWDAGPFGPMEMPFVKMTGHLASDSENNEEEFHERRNLVNAVGWITFLGPSFWGFRYLSWTAETVDRVQQGGLR